MFTWPNIIVLILRIANALVTAANQDRWMQAGADAEIAKISAAILAKTKAGKLMLEKVNAMSDADVDSALVGLEPK